MEEKKLRTGNPNGGGVPTKISEAPIGDYTMGPEKTENNSGGTYPISLKNHAPTTETEETNANPPLDYCRNHLASES